MRLRFSILAIAVLIFSLTSCSKMDLEEEASQGVWFNRMRQEVLYLDKENSAFILQKVGWYASDDGPTFVFRNGSEVSLPYRIESDRFVFGENHISTLMAGGGTFVYGYGEASFDQVGNLIIQLVTLHPTADGYQKDPRPDGTWECIYVLKDSSFLGNR